MTHLGRAIPIGLLMREHVLIGMMITVLKKKLEKPSDQGLTNPCFIETLVDFFKTYADRCHHGKEEDILFRDLSKKQLSEEHQKIMSELVKEHVYARQTVGRLRDAGARQSQNQQEALDDVKSILKELAKFYPLHIEKEDKHFFYPVMEYFTQQELDAMLQKFREFDRRLIHEKYENTLKSLQDTKSTVRKNHP